MKIERINENQIRCTLTSFDLSVRNLNLGELAYGSEKARSLFREMIQKASNEVGFDAEDIPLMVEAIPLSNESVMLVITKIEDPEELDTRFSKFTPDSDAGSDDWTGLATELLEGADSLMDFLKPVPETQTPAQDSVPSAGENEPSPAPQQRAYRFDSLDQVSEAAHVVGRHTEAENILYKKPQGGAYYLVISGEQVDSLEFSRICNILAEYGVKVRHDARNAAYYQEHYEIIIRRRALQTLAGI